MAEVKTGYYENKKKKEDIVRAIYYPSFEEEVAIEDFNGYLKCWEVDTFLEQYQETDKKFKLKEQRVKDGKGSAGF